LGYSQISHIQYGPRIYTDEYLKWDKPPVAVCLLIDLSATLPLKIYWNAPLLRLRASHFKSSRVYNQFRHCIFRSSAQMKYRIVEDMPHINATSKISSIYRGPRIIIASFHQEFLLRKMVINWKCQKMGGGLRGNRGFPLSKIRFILYICSI
jgi:hypothetical protein